LLKKDIKWKKKHTSRPNSKSLIFYHFVFVTKYRREVLIIDIIEEITKIVIHVCKENKGFFEEGNGEEDHYHLLVKLPPKIAPGKFVKLVKGRSSKIIREKYWEEIFKSKLSFLEPILLLFLRWWCHHRNHKKIHPRTRKSRLTHGLKIRGLRGPIRSSPFLLFTAKYSNI
jgi:REP element-mobilizing transposase RayT